MLTFTIRFLLLLFMADPAPAESQNDVTDPLLGRWLLERDRSQYGGGARRRQEETFECVALGARRECTIRSRFEDGGTANASFTMSYDGPPQPVRGLSDVDAVTLRRVSQVIVDATFGYRGRPSAGYRAVVSEDRRHLTLIAVDPVSRAVLHSVIVYRRE